MKKILLLLTGGTIGSERENKTLGLKKGGSNLLDLYLSEGRKDVSFDVQSPINVLSENANADDICKIISIVSNTDIQNYSGVIVAYGTDTLAYAASSAAMALHAIPIPVVFVAADKPPEEEGSNGVINFSGAVDFICDTNLNGVYVCYKNPEDSVKIHLGSRILQAAGISGDFESVTNLHFGTVTEGKFVPNSSPQNPSVLQIMQKKGSILPKLGRAANLLFIAPCPLTDFRIYDIEKSKIDAVVVELYHSGTGSTQGEESLAEFIKRCAEIGIPVVLASYPYQDGRRYITTEILEKNGGIFAYRMSTEAALAKTFVYFLEDKKISLAEYMAKDLFFETIG